MFLIEEANEDYEFVGVYFFSSGKLLRKLNIIVMGIKRSILFDKMLTAFLLISKC